MSQSLQKALEANPIEVVEEILHQTFADNTSVALVAWLTLVSGLTRYPFSAGISGRSSAGKSFIADRVAQLMPRGTVCTASRMTLASLFAIRGLHALVMDEFIADESFRRVHRQLVSRGSAHQLLATSAGKLRHEVVKGPISTLDVTLSDKDREFQDANRLLVCQLDDSVRQVAHTSVLVVESYTAAGRHRELRWNHLRRTARSFLRTLRLRTTVDLPDVLDLVTGEGRIDAPRRLDLICRLSCVIALLRQSNRQAVAGVIQAERADVETALNLLHRVRVSDDQETISQYAMNFLGLLQRITFHRDGLDVGQIQERLNSDDLRGLSSDPDHSPICSRPNRHWTRRIIEERLFALQDNGLVHRCEKKRPYKWSLASGAETFQAIGPVGRILRAQGN